MSKLSKLIFLPLIILQLVAIAKAQTTDDDMETKAQNDATRTLNFQIRNAKQQMEYLQDSYNEAKAYCAQNPNDADCSNENGDRGGDIKDYEDWLKEYNDYTQNSQQYIQKYKEQNVEKEKTRKEILNIIEEGKKNGATISPNLERSIKSSYNLNELNKYKERISKDVAFQTSPEGIEKKRLSQKFQSTFNSLAFKIQEDNEDMPLWMAQNKADSIMLMCDRKSGIDEKCLDEIRAKYNLPELKPTSQEQNTENSVTQAETSEETAPETPEIIPEPAAPSSSDKAPTEDDSKTPQHGIGKNGAPLDSEISGCSSNFGLFSGLIQTGSTIFAKLRDLIYVVAGFGILGVAIGGFFGNLNWKWLGAIVIALVVIASTGEIINLVVGCEQFTKNMITDTLK